MKTSLKLKNSIEKLEEKLTVFEISKNKMEQYTRSNNFEIEGVSPNISDDNIKDKVI